MSNTKYQISKSEIEYARKELSLNIGLPCLIIAVLMTSIILFGLFTSSLEDNLHVLRDLAGVFEGENLELWGLLLFIIAMWIIAIFTFNFGKTTKVKTEVAENDSPLFKTAFDFSLYASSARKAWFIAWIIGTIVISGMYIYLTASYKTVEFVEAFMYIYFGLLMSALLGLAFIGMPMLWRNVIKGNGFLLLGHWVLVTLVVIFWYIALMVCDIIIIVRIIKDVWHMNHICRNAC